MYKHGYHILKGGVKKTTVDTHLINIKNNVKYIRAIVVIC